MFQRHVIEDLNHLLRANHGVLGGGSERAVRLSAIAPHASADPFPRHSFANLINDARTIAVRNDPWIRHPDVKRVFTFLNITWIHAGKATRILNSPARGCASSISPRTSTSPAAPCLSYQAAFISSHDVHTPKRIPLCRPSFHSSFDTRVRYQPHDRNDDVARAGNPWFRKCERNCCRINCD